MSAFGDTLVFVWKEPDEFTQHTLSRLDDERTVCGIELDRLPFEDASLPPEELHRTWYTDHDRSDVIACPECRSALPPIERLMFDLRVLVARIYDELTHEHQTEVWDVITRHEGERT